MSANNQRIIPVISEQTRLGALRDDCRDFRRCTPSQVRRTWVGKVMVARRELIPGAKTCVKFPQSPSPGVKHLHNRPGWWRSSTAGRSKCAGAAELLLRCAGSSLGRNVREEAEGRALKLTRIRTRSCVPAGGVHAVGACCCTSRPLATTPLTLSPLVILVRVPVVRSRLARPTWSRPADAPLAARGFPR